MPRSKSTIKNSLLVRTEADENGEPRQIATAIRTDPSGRIVLVTWDSVGYMRARQEAYDRFLSVCSGSSGSFYNEVVIREGNAPARNCRRSA